MTSQKYHLQHLYWLCLSVLIIGLDQFTKYLANTYLHAYQPHSITRFLNLTLAFNTGAAFNFLSNASGWQLYFFSLLAFIVSAVLIVWLLRLPRTDKLGAFALAMIIAGALGNLIDRILWGHVIDFIDLHIGVWHWPVFNVADSAITVGATILILGILFKNENSTR